MPESRTPWTCPSCRNTYAVPSTAGLVLCPSCMENRLEFAGKNQPKESPEMSMSMPMPIPEPKLKLAGVRFFRWMSRNGWLLVIAVAASAVVGLVANRAGLIPWQSISSTREAVAEVANVFVVGSHESQAKAAVRVWFKENLNDPRSVEEVRWWVSDINDPKEKDVSRNIAVRVKYRTTLFGEKVLHDDYFVVDDRGVKRGSPGSFPKRVRQELDISP